MKIYKVGDTRRVWRVEQPGSIEVEGVGLMILTKTTRFQVEQVLKWRYPDTKMRPEWVEKKVFLETAEEVPSWWRRLFQRKPKIPKAIARDKRGS